METVKKPFMIPPLSAEILDSIKRKYLDVRYCDQSDAQLLDLYLPNEGAGPYPVVVHFHGGAFRRGDKREATSEPMLRALWRGYAVADVRYRLSGEAPYPAMLYDAKAAIRFLRAQAKTYDLDPAYIAAWGPSSGGWLVSMLGATGGQSEFEDLSMGNAGVSSRVQAVIDWCGPCGGFDKMDEQLALHGFAGTHSDPASPESRFLGAAVSQSEELCRTASPVAHLQEDAPPFFILHGSDDKTVPVEQSVILYRALCSAAGENRGRLLICVGKGHHGAPWYHEKWVSNLCLDFLDEQLEAQKNGNGGKTQ